MIRFRHRFVAAVISLALFGVAAPVSAQQSADAQYEALAKAYFERGFQENPTQATFAGVHDFDARLDDMSAAHIQAGFAYDRQTLEKLEAIPPGSLSPEVAIDRQMLIDQINDDLLLGEELEQWRHNPDSYTSLASGAIFLLISRDFAPLETRMRDAIARENAIPAMLQQARANMTTVDSITQRIAAEQAEGSVGFFAQTVPLAFGSVKDPQLQAQLKTANTSAMTAMREWTAFIKSMKPSGTYAIGKDAYEKRLLYEDALHMPVEHYLAYGERALAKTRAQFIATAKKIDPTKTPQQVYASLTTVHPAPGALVATAQQDLVRLRAFLIAHRILTVPPDANIKVIETPPFQRAFITAAEDSPGALETVATQAYYYVTPVDPSWPKARQEGFLAQFNDFQRPIISAHEVYPGHFTNFAVDRHLQLSLTRKLLGSSEYAEGWAHYSEQMMVDQGWGNGNPRVRLAQLSEALLRECRYVAGVKLHTQGWTIEQAENLMTTQCFQTQAVALEESLRGTQDPMYGYYTLGKLMILKLRDDYKKKMGAAYSLQKFHDAFLAHGDPPIPLLRPLLLGFSDDGRVL